VDGRLKDQWLSDYVVKGLRGISTRIKSKKGASKNRFVIGIGGDPTMGLKERF
jgi:hypothetical protein